MNLDDRIDDIIDNLTDEHLCIIRDALYQYLLQW